MSYYATNSEGNDYNYKVVMSMTYDSSNGYTIEEVIDGHLFEHVPTLEECMEELPVSLATEDLDEESKVISIMYDIWACDVEYDMWIIQEGFFIVDANGVPV